MIFRDEPGHRVQSRSFTSWEQLFTAGKEFISEIVGSTKVAGGGWRAGEQTSLSINKAPFQTTDLAR